MVSTGDQPVERVSRQIAPYHWSANYFEYKMVVELTV